MIFGSQTCLSNKSSFVNSALQFLTQRELLYSCILVSIHTLKYLEGVNIYGSKKRK
jgi:hypothetical protein